MFLLEIIQKHNFVLCFFLKSLNNIMSLVRLLEIIEALSFFVFLFEIIEQLCVIGVFA